MGLTVHVETLAGESHPDWDDGKYSGDRQLVGKLQRVPSDDRLINDDWYHRPTDFAAFRRVLAEYDVNENRWAKLAALLEADDRYWIRFCA